MAEKKVRNSNLEILRILSMFMIILAHYGGHGGIIDQSETASGHILGLFMKTGGKLGVICFVLISTYFMCEQKFKSESLLKTYLQTVFYAVLDFIFLLIAGEAVGIGTGIKSLFTVFLGDYWFVTAYIGMYLFQPLLKKCTDTLDSRSSFTVIAVMTAVFIIIPFALGNVPFLTNNLVYFCYLFFVGNHLRKYTVKPNFLSRYPMPVFIICASAIPLLTFLMEQILKSHPAVVNRYHFILYDLNSPLMLIAGIALFLYFKQRQPTAIRFVNQFARNMFGVYLLHDNVYFRSFLWHKLLRIDSVYDKNIAIIIAHALICVCIIMFCAALIEIIRRFIENKLMHSALIQRLCLFWDAHYSTL